MALLLKKVYMNVQSQQLKNIILLICYSLLITIPKVSAQEQCDFAKCLSKVSNYLKYLQMPKSQFNCLQLYEETTPICSSNCMRQYLFGGASSFDANSSNFLDYCEEKLNRYQKADYACIAKHSYRLLTCYANVSSITSNDVRDDVMCKVACRKALEYKKCPVMVLEECGEQAVKVLQNLFFFLQKYFRIPSCDLQSLQEVSVLPVNFNYPTELMVTAKCFDVGQEFVTDMFFQYIQDDADINEFLCGTDYFYEQVEYYFQKYHSDSKDCRNLSNVSKALMPKLLSFAKKKCELVSPNPEVFPTTSGQLFGQKSFYPNEHYDLLEQSCNFVNSEIHLFPSSSTTERTAVSESKGFPEESSSDAPVQNFEISTLLKRITTAATVVEDLKVESISGDSKDINDSKTDLNYLKTNNSFILCHNVLLALFSISSVVFYAFYFSF